MVEEIFRTIGTHGAARALVLMEQLGLLEVLLEPLSAHLRGSIEAHEEFERAPMVRHLAALGEMIGLRGEQPRPMVLACMFADLYLARARESDPERRAVLIRDLQNRGFARGECEQMRLLLDALMHMTALTRHVRRIARRPYYNEARRLLEFVAPVNGVGVGELDRFLAELNENGGIARRRFGTAEGQNGGGRKRKRRRGGRRHRRRPLEGAAGVAPSVSATIANGPAMTDTARFEAQDASPEAIEQAEANKPGCVNGRER
jgi:hypothetical protein